MSVPMTSSAGLSSRGGIFFLRQSSRGGMKNYKNAHVQFGPNFEHLQVPHDPQARDIFYFILKIELWQKH